MIHENDPYENRNWVRYAIHIINPVALRARLNHQAPLRCLNRVEYLRDWIRGWILTVSILLMPAISEVGNAADSANNDAFILRFDSRITTTDDDGTKIVRIVGRFMLDPVDGLPPWYYAGFGTVSHTELIGYDFGTDGGVVGHLEVSPDDGLVSLIFGVFSPPWQWRGGIPGEPGGTLMEA